MKQFEVSTKGKLRIFSTDEIELREVVDLPQTATSSEEGYKASVLECHEVLDELSILSATGVSCEDPKCKSRLGHRLRTLRDLYISQKGIIEEIDNSRNLSTDTDFARAVAKILEGKKSH